MIQLGAFIVKYWRIILPILGAGIISGSFFGYGAIKYRAGYKDAERALKSKMEAVAREQSQKAHKDKERIRDVEKDLDDAGIDRGLRDLGIMRRNDDR